MNGHASDASPEPRYGGSDSKRCRPMALRLAWLALTLGLAVQAGPARAEGKTRTVTLDEAVRRAIARNPETEVAAQEIKRAEGLADQARATWLPTLNANGTYTRLDNDRELNGRVILSANQLNANLALTVPLVAPRQWVGHARSRDVVSIARLNSVDTRRELALAAARTFLTVIAQRRVLGSAERALVTARSHEDYAKTRFEGGVGNRLDAVRASQERATAETKVRSQEVALVRAREALGVILGEDGPVDAAEEVDLAAPPSVEAALGEAGTRRADVVAQKERVDVTRKAVRDMWADYMPLLSAVVQPFYQNPPTFTQPATGWQAQLLLTIPVFDGGNRYGLADERRALHAQAKARLEASLRNARSEVRVAFEALRREDEALVQARDAARLAHESLDLAQQAYRAGATSNIEVVDAERRAHEADTAAAVAEDASRQARLDLLAACGRFP
jgi:outer membrane protein TolC